MILSIARDEYRRDIEQASYVVEVNHNIFDHHSCSQWVRVYRDFDTDHYMVIFKGVTLRFDSLEQFLQSEGANMILQTMLHDFMEYADTNVMTNMDFITIQVHYVHKNCSKRMSILHNYLHGEIFKDDVCDPEKYARDQHVAKLIEAFHKQLTFGHRALKSTKTKLT